VRVLALVLLILGVASGCVDSFEPFKASDNLHFSIFGYLNADADTQWIRVTPIRQSVFTTPDKLDATVTLENMGTGVTIELNDSVFRFQTALEGGSASWAHNYWTDAPIEYGATYLLSVVAANGETTTAVVPVPDELGDVVILTRATNPHFSGLVLQHFLRVQNEYTPMALVIHYVSDRAPALHAGTFTDCPFDPGAPRVYSIRQTKLPTTTIGDTIEMEISKTLQSTLLATDTFPAYCVVARREVMIASPGFVWPTGSQYSPSAPALGNLPSTLDGGVGFVGGLATRTVPFEDCTLRPLTWGSSCEMRHNDQSATVEGVVTDSRCGWGVEGATVELSVLGTSPTVVRTTTTDQLGHYRIGALVGGTSYAVLVSQPLLWPPVPFANERAYLDFTGTLTAQAGTTQYYNLDLQRLVECEFTQ